MTDSYLRISMHHAYLYATPFLFLQVNKAPADLVIVMEHLGNANMTTPEVSQQ